jgi:penicillin-binding protein 1C
MHRFIKSLIKPVLIISFCLIALNLFLRFFPYPEFEAYMNRSYGYPALDRNGLILRVFPAEDGVKRDWVSLEEIPQGALKVFLRAEDSRFYWHFGVDPIAVAGAALRNISGGRTVSGASTITMQLARLVKPGRHGFKGKILEAFDALRLEARLSKKQILELWINNIPFGSNIEGISAMTRARFGRSIAELDDTRALLLAVIPRRPSLYDPALNPKAAVKAAAELSGRCAPDVSEAALEAAAAEAAEPDTLSAPVLQWRQNREKIPFYAPHFTERASSRRNGKNKQPLRTTLDLELQSYAEKRLAEELALLGKNRVSNGAILVIDNEDGSVLVYVGSASWFDDSIKGKIDGVTTENQPGSCLKPFLYALALEKGLSQNDILPDIPAVFGSSEAYSPENFNRRFNGPVRLRVALASSLNLPAVNLLERVGVRAFEETLVSFGFNSISHSIGTNGLGLALGNAEVSLEEMVRAFSVFPNRGLLKEMRFTAESDHDESGTQRILSPESAWIISDILSDQGSRFTGFGTAPVLATEFTSIFKTGTANQFQHIWALGATPRFTAGVWMGNFSGETVVGRTGSSIPARITADLLRALENNSVSQNPAQESSNKNSFDKSGFYQSGFERPGGLHLTKICSLSGMAASSACTGVLHEWLYPRRIPPECTWHRGGLSYPPEYQAWLRERFRSGNVSRTGNKNGAYIRIPVAGSVFYFDPSLPAEAQAVRIETAGFSADALVYDNDALQGSLNQAGVFVLPLFRGRHRIFVEDDNGSLAGVEIEVR